MTNMNILYVYRLQGPLSSKLNSFITFVDKIGSVISSSVNTRAKVTGEILFNTFNIKIELNLVSCHLNYYIRLYFIERVKRKEK